MQRLLPRRWLIGNGILFPVLQRFSWSLKKPRVPAIPPYTWEPPNARKITIMLEECGLSYDMQPICLASKAGCFPMIGECDVAMSGTST